MRESPGRHAQVHETKKPEVKSRKRENLRLALKKLKENKYKWLKYAAIPLAAVTLGQQVNRAGAQEGPPPNTPDNELLLPSVNQELYAAKNFIADNEPDAIAIARQLDFLSSDYEHPSNMCGPLAAKILYDSGYLTDEMFPEGFNAHDFWLATPDRLNQLFENLTAPGDSGDNVEGVAPGEAGWRYNEIESSPRRLSEYDFFTNELELGDFLYSVGDIPNGGYDHMFAVTRIERFGNYYRVYSVTNQPTPEGFVIQEFLLYDSSNPEAGLFQMWQNSWTHGKTGQLGFHWWRRLVENEDL